VKFCKAAACFSNEPMLQQSNDFPFIFITISVLLVLLVSYQEPGVQLRPHERH